MEAPGLSNGVPLTHKINIEYIDLSSAMFDRCFTGSVGSDDRPISTGCDRLLGEVNAEAAEGSVYRYFKTILQVSSDATAAGHHFLVQLVGH